MKLCKRCHEKPLANIHGRYCIDCREIARKEAEEREKYMRHVRNKRLQEKQKAIKRAAEVNERTGYKDKFETVECKDCVYWKIFYGATYACHYCIDTGNLRDIPPKDCYKRENTPYTPKK